MWQLRETSGWVGTDQGAVHGPEDMGEGFLRGCALTDAGHSVSSDPLHGWFL